MLIFKILFVGILLYELTLALFIKNNYNGFQDRLIDVIRTIDLEDYIRNRFPNTWISGILVTLLLFLLCIC